MAELKIAAAAENLDAVIAFVEEQMHLAGCPARMIAQVDMAVEEIFVNIASYAYQPGTGEAEISCTAAGEPPSVTVRFADSGRPYDRFGAPTRTSPSAPRSARWAGSAYSW